MIRPCSYTFEDFTEFLNQRIWRYLLIFLLETVPLWKPQFSVKTRQHYRMIISTSGKVSDEITGAVTGIPQLTQTWFSNINIFSFLMNLNNKRTFYSKRILIHSDVKKLICCKMEFSELVKVEFSNFWKWNKILAQNKLKSKNMSNLPIFFFCKHTNYFKIVVQNLKTTLRKWKIKCILKSAIFMII